MASAAAGLQVINLAQLARIDNFFNHLHVRAHAGLEADSQNFAALLLGPHHLYGLVKGDGKGLFQHDIDAGLQRVNGAGGMLSVVGTDTNRVKITLFSRQQLFI